MTTVIIFVLMLVLLGAYFYHVSKPKAESHEQPRNLNSNGLKPEKKVVKPKFDDILNAPGTSSPPKGTSTGAQTPSQHSGQEPLESRKQKLKALAEEVNAMEVPKELHEAAQAEEALSASEGAQPTGGSDTSQGQTESKTQQVHSAPSPLPHEVDIPSDASGDGIVGESAEGVAVRYEQRNAQVLNLSAEELEMLQLQGMKSSGSYRKNKSASLKEKAKEIMNQSVEEVPSLHCNEGSPADGCTNQPSQPASALQPESKGVPDNPKADDAAGSFAQREGRKVLAHGIHLPSLKASRATQHSSAGSSSDRQPEKCDHLSPAVTAHASCDEQEEVTFVTREGFTMIETPPLPFRNKRHLDNFINYLLRTDHGQRHTTPSTSRCHIALMTDVDVVLQLSEYDKRVLRRTSLNRLIHNYVHGEDVSGLYMQLVELESPTGELVLLTPSERLNCFREYIQRHELEKGSRKILAYVEHSETERKRIYHIHTLFYLPPVVNGGKGEKKLSTEGFKAVADRSLSELGNDVQ